MRFIELSPTHGIESVEPIVLFISPMSTDQAQAREPKRLDFRGLFSANHRGRLNSFRRLTSPKKVESRRFCDKTPHSFPNLRPSSTTG